MRNANERSWGLTEEDAEDAEGGEGEGAEAGGREEGEDGADRHHPPLAHHPP